MALLRITTRPGYEDLRTVLEAILRGNLETLEQDQDVEWVDLDGAEEARHLAKGPTP